MSFADQLKSERTRLGLSQAELATLLDVSKSSVEKWEYGTKTPIPIAQEGALARLQKTSLGGAPSSPRTGRQRNRSAFAGEI
jgi:transcriptional regulator with XRE-family HTH domain